MHAGQDLSGRVTYGGRSASDWRTDPRCSVFGRTASMPSQRWPARRSQTIEMLKAMWLTTMVANPLLTPMPNQASITSKAGLGEPEQQHDGHGHVRDDDREVEHGVEDVPRPIGTLVPVYGESRPRCRAPSTRWWRQKATTHRVPYRVLEELLVVGHHPVGTSRNEKPPQMAHVADDPENCRTRRRITIGSVEEARTPATPLSDSNRSTQGRVATRGGWQKSSYGPRLPYRKYTIGGDRTSRSSGSPRTVQTHRTGQFRAAEELGHDVRCRAASILGAAEDVGGHIRPDARA